jgi:hypothetical protein
MGAGRPPDDPPARPEQPPDHTHDPRRTAVSGGGHREEHPEPDEQRTPRERTPGRRGRARGGAGGDAAPRGH